MLHNRSRLLQLIFRVLLMSDPDQELLAIIFRTKRMRQLPELMN